MYASIRRYKKPSTSELNRLINEDFLPVISELRGFVAYYAIDAGNGTWATMSVFDSQAAAEQSNRLAAEWIAKNAPSIAASKPEITVGEVVAHKLATTEVS